MNKKLLLGTGIQALREQLTMQRIKNWFAAGGGRGRPVGQNRAPGMGELPGGENYFIDPLSSKTVVSSRQGNIRPDAMLPRSRTYGYSAPGRGAGLSGLLNTAGAAVSTILTGKNSIKALENLTGTPGLDELSNEEMVLIKTGIDPFFKGDQTGADTTLTDKYYYYKRMLDAIDNRGPRQPINREALLASGLAGGLTGRSRQPISQQQLQQAGITPDMIRQAQQAATREATQTQKEKTSRRKTGRKLSIYFVASIAALLAAGFTVAQASKFVKKVRANLRGRKASLDIVKLASMGDTEGAQMLLDKEFGKTGIDMNKVASAVEGVSDRELRIAARVLKKEIGS